MVDCIIWSYFVLFGPLGKELGKAGDLSLIDKIDFGCAELLAQEYTDLLKLSK